MAIDMDNPRGDQPHDYYATLNLSSRRQDPSLSQTEIKTAYRKALLAHHPDKLKAKSSQVSIDTIALAYKILSSPDLRQEYDKGLTTTQASDKIFHTGLDTVDLDDLHFDESKDVWMHGCRCGDEGGFVVTEDELEKNAEDGELIVGCRGCSLWLRVLFGVEEG